jgi:hypothetical protein
MTIGVNWSGRCFFAFELYPRRGHLKIIREKERPGNLCIYEPYLLKKRIFLSAIICFSLFLGLSL